MIIKYGENWPESDFDFKSYIVRNKDKLWWLRKAVEKNSNVDYVDVDWLKCVKPEHTDTINSLSKKTGVKTGDRTIWYNLSQTDFNTMKRNRMPIIVPQTNKEREIANKEFFDLCKESISNMESNSIYWQRVTELVNKIWKSNLARVMASFARVESAGKNPKANLWTFVLYRYESPTLYSLSYFHILVDWPWKVALNNLWLNQWDVYNDPVKAGMWFLWYWCEKELNCRNTKNKFNIENCLNPNEQNRFLKAAKVYNGWSHTYPSSLKEAYSIFKDME
jgi:hypothetical protein